MSLLPQEPSSIAKVLDSSFKLYKASFMKIIGFAIAIALINMVSGFSAKLIEVDENNFTGIPENIGAFGVIMLIIMVVSFIIYGALIYQIDQIARYQDCSFSEALGVGLKKSPKMFLAAFLYGFAILIGTLLLVIPGIILSLSLVFYSYYIVLEDLPAYQSLKTSHKLVWQDWWRTFAVFTVPGIILVILFVGFGAVTAFLASDGGDSTLIELVLYLFYGIFLPYFYTLGYVQYHDLKLRKSGSDLEARMTQ